MRYGRGALDLQLGHVALGDTFTVKSMPVQR